jgi:outer membrane lipoprotein carrier protein
MNFRSFLLFTVLTVGAAAAPACASGIGALQDFVRQTQSARADFTQKVLGKGGRVVQRASGTMEFARPDRFRWSYDKPYRQLIVGDGSRLWVYDVELKQVTVRKLGQALGGSPAALLAGSNDLDKMFRLRDMGSRNGLEWLEATPRDEKGSFESVRMGFRRNILETMELRDSFGQTTVIHFSHMQTNPRLAAGQFVFVPPKGVDVLGDVPGGDARGAR